RRQRPVCLLNLIPLRSAVASVEGGAAHRSGQSSRRIVVEPMVKVRRLRDAEIDGHSVREGQVLELATGIAGWRIPLRVLELAERPPLAKGFVRVKARRSDTIADAGRQEGDAFELADGTMVLFEAIERSQVEIIEGELSAGSIAGLAERRSAFLEAHTER